ncbi:MAG: ribosomal RNA small subunit methyltransferase A [Candidatus Komeilibacteria bacterium]|jgi:16S rRNA (adenine1518-N6/adenine1519-N6)-dimethyltransferase|nr:ribosomal RNA small subunit methyltransferase A [Candidatus Komeilibacteria bacterium]MBT4447983.1 ribosomal RNA small subunit methyltransferase A [Candidatus Komeilibacteria bacterium]
MNLQELQFLLKKYHLTPNKVRGQNFLISDEVLDDIITGSKIKKEELILEVGPGLGALTQRLLDDTRQVVALEVDKNLEELLNTLAKVNKNLEIVWQDILSLTDDQWQGFLDKYKTKDYKIVANIPYYLTGKFIQKFVLANKKPLSMTIMVQKEVAQRVVDNKKQSLLSLAVAFYAKSKLIRIVNKDNFYPQPKVDSAILYIYDIKAWNYNVDEKRTWQIIKRGFAFKRKKLFNNLLSDPNIDKEKLQIVFDKIGLDSNIRAEKLNTNDWLDIVKYL